MGRVRIGMVAYPWISIPLNNIDGIVYRKFPFITCSTHTMKARYGAIKRNGIHILVISLPTKPIKSMQKTIAYLKQTCPSRNLDRLIAENPIKKVFVRMLPNCHDWNLEENAQPNAYSIK